MLLPPPEPCSHAPPCPRAQPGPPSTVVLLCRAWNANGGGGPLQQREALVDPLGFSSDGDISSHVGDFMAMAAVFERATTAANLDVARHTRLPVQFMPARLQEWGMRFVFRADLIHERAYAWQCAEALVASGGAGLSFIWNHMVTPIINGHAPIAR